LRSADCFSIPIAEGRQLRRKERERGRKMGSLNVSE
jgi:hypothetical protein